MKTIHLKGRNVTIRLTNRMQDALLCLISTPNRTLWMDCDVAKALERMGLASIMGVRGLDTDKAYKVRLGGDGKMLCWNYGLVSDWQYEERMACDAARRINAEVPQF